MNVLRLIYCGTVVDVQVLEQEGVGRQKKVKYNSLLPGDDDPVSESGILVHEKRTRFSLSHDQDSIGLCCLAAVTVIISVISCVFCQHCLTV